MGDFSVHDQPDFERVYDEDEVIEVRRGDLRALLDLATGSMDFGSGFWDNEPVEIARKIAGVLDIAPVLVTPHNFTYQYVCQAKGEHKWREVNWGSHTKWYCDVCRWR
jgi:hypothetical protein